MAAAQVVPVSYRASFDESKQSDRQAMVDSVLGTMGAEDENPSEEALALMQNFIAGEITLDQMSEAILAQAARKVHEANSRRLAVR